MILKWVGRFVYIILVMFSALYIIQIGYISRNNAYYVNEVMDHWNERDTYLEGVSTLQYLDYYQKDPFYTYNTKDHGGVVGETNFELSIHAVGITYNDIFYDGFLVFINNVEIYENGSLVEDPILKLTANLSDATILIDDTYENQGSVVFDPQSESYYGNTPALMLFDITGNLINDNGTEDDTSDDILATLAKITIDYSNRSTNEEAGTYIFNSDVTGGSPLFVGANGTVNDGAIYTATDLVVEASDYQLSNQFVGEEFSDTDVQTLGLNDQHGDVSDYNGEIWRIMVFYILAVAVITYFLFFHKIVRAKYLDKKAASQTNSNVVEAEVEPIFKDAPAEDNEDGK